MYVLIRSKGFVMLICSRVRQSKLMTELGVNGFFPLVIYVVDAFFLISLEMWVKRVSVLCVF